VPVTRQWLLLLAIITFILLWAWQQAEKVTCTEYTDDPSDTICELDE
jgi:hypothetical protein